MRFLDAKRSSRLAGVVPLEADDTGIFVSMDDLLVHLDGAKDVLDAANVAFTRPSQVVEALRIQLRKVMLDCEAHFGEFTID
jgi:hypothetical protein